MSTHTNLRRTIKALCAPAVIAMTTSHVPVVEAAVNAGSADYAYLSPDIGSSSSSTTTTTFSFHVLKNEGFIPQQERIGPLVVGSPRPLQLVNAGVSESGSRVIPIVSTFRNCIMVSVSLNPNQESGSSSGDFSITYTVADATGQQDSGTLFFNESDFNSFNEEPMGSQCDDPGFQGSTAVADTASTQTNTPVTINVLGNDTLGREIQIDRPPVLAAALTVDGRPVVQVADTSANGGTLRTNDDGTVTYTPAPGFSGRDTFNYAIVDYGQKGFENLNRGATVTVDVEAAPPPDPAVIAVITRDSPNGAIVADGNSISVADTDAAMGESVTFDGSRTLFFREAAPTRYRWFVGNSETPQQDSESPTFTAKLPDGTSQVRLVALFEGDVTLTATSSISVTVIAPAQIGPATITVMENVVPNGTNLDVPDTDSIAGEVVPFDGSSTMFIGEGSPLRSFQWFVGNSETPQGTDATFTPRLPDGVSQVRLVVTDDFGEGESLTATSAITVTVAEPQANVAIIAVNGSQVANGGNFTVDDTDNALGETATFDGSQTVLGDQIRPNRFQWFVNDQLQQDGDSPTFQFKLNDGASQVTLIATANDGDFEFARATSSINVTVAAAAVTPSLATIVVNGTAVTNGGTFSLTDTDDTLGEIANFDGSQTTLAGGGQPTRFQWFVNDVLQQDSESPLFQIRLDENTTSSVRLTATDGESTATSVANVAVALTLANIPNLTPNQRSVAQALDNLCTQLAQRAAANPESLTDNQEDLQDRCRGILAAGTSDQVRALDELGAQDFNGARLQTLLFTNSLYAGVMDRLMALRGGVKGLSLAGLNIVIDGKSVPLAELQQMVGHLLGGGAAADEPGSLLGDKWGAWSRGNFTFGDKDRSKNDNGFDADQFSLTAGLDYRLSDKMVIGGALAYGSSNLSYNPNNEGGLDTESWAVSLYGSRYAGKSFYFDALINAANSSYEAHRRISYNEAAFDAAGNVIGTQAVQRDARGDTDGLTLSGGLSGGYDFIYKGFTISPNLGVFYVDSQIDQFREGGSRGLNLIYDEQTFQSLTGTLGLRVNYAWNVSWGVLVPYFRSDYVREFKKDVEAFNVRFASDPADPAPPIVVQSDSPDQSYVRLVGGISGQFPFGISGYVEYQRLQSFEFVDFNDLSMGLRVQYRY